jgi:hypothetical protein
MLNQTLNITGLTPEQIEQTKAIVEAFKAKNELANIQTSNQPKSTTTESQNFNLNDLFFDSEILENFNRSLLYGDRI